MGDSTSTTDRWRLCAILTAAVTVILYAAALSTTYKPTPDSAEYMGLARSLSQGTGNDFNGRTDSRYGPLTSVLLAGIMTILKWVSPTASAVLVIKAVQILLAVLWSWAAWRLARRYVSERWAVWVGLLVLANISVFQHCMFILSDMLYGCLSTWGLVLLTSARPYKPHVFGFLLVILASLTRSVGIALPVGTGLWLLFAQRGGTGPWRRLAASILLPAFCAAPMVIWQLSCAEAEHEYLQWWADSVSHMPPAQIAITVVTHVSNVVLLRVVQMVLNIDQIGLPSSFILIVALLPAIGWWRTFTGPCRLPQWYSIIFMAILCVWLSDQGTRFALPLLPLLIIYAMVGLAWLHNRLTQQDAFGKALGLLTVAALAMLAWPLVQHILAEGRPPGAMDLLRTGYVYCTLAGVTIALMLVRQCRLGKIKLAGILLVLMIGFYVGMSWLYCGAYAALEHRIITSRQPMLQGYMPFYRMGLWLKEQRHTPEPVFCSNASIVHLASGRITRLGPLAPDDRLVECKVTGPVSLLLLQDSRPDSVSQGSYHNGLCTTLDQVPDLFSLVATKVTDDDLKFLLYEYRPAQETCFP